MDSEHVCMMLMFGGLGLAGIGLFLYILCSNCGEDFSFYDNAFLHDGYYCPNCGARMDEVKKEEN